MAAFAGFLALLAGAGDPALAASAPGSYFSAPLRVRKNPYTFAQTPAWTRGGDVLSNEPDRSGTEQVWLSRLNGSRLHWLTCNRVGGPNGFPQERLQGDWILFCLMGAQPEHWEPPASAGTAPICS